MWHFPGAFFVALSSMSHSETVLSHDLAVEGAVIIWASQFTLLFLHLSPWDLLQKGCPAHAELLSNHFLPLFPSLRARPIASSRCPQPPFVTNYFVNNY